MKGLQTNKDWGLNVLNSEIYLLPVLFCLSINAALIPPKMYLPSELYCTEDMVF